VTGSGWFWIALAAMAIGGLFSTLFHSLKDMARTTLERIVERNSNRSASGRVQRILEDVNGHSTAVALPRIVCNMVMAVATVFWVEAMLGEVASPQAQGILIGIGLASVLIWVFGLVLPHSVSMHAAERTVYTWSWLIRATYIVLLPLNRVVELSDEAVRRLTGKDEESDAKEIEAELMSVVEEGQEEGQFDQVERDMIEAVVDFRSTTVEQIMTPRTEVEALELTNNLGTITHFIAECRHSRIPVYEESLDHIAGMFYIKDLMRWLATEGSRGSGKPFELRSILRPALFVPEAKTIRELLEELVNKKVHVAMVADEYGGTAGLVTLEDIVEEIFGEIQDEYEQTEDMPPDVAVSTDTRTAEIDGRANIHDVNEKLKEIGVHLPEGEEYETVGGLVVTRLGHIPAQGECLRLADVLLTVLEAEPTRVLRVRLEVAVPLEPVIEESSAAAPEESIAAGRREETPE
jgi:putative hemolysin